MRKATKTEKSGGARRRTADSNSARRAQLIDMSEGGSTNRGCAFLHNPRVAVRPDPGISLKHLRKTRCCTRRRTGIRRPVPSYYEGTAHPIPVLLRIQHLVFLSYFSSRTGENRWSSKFKFQRQLEFKTRPFCSYPHPPSPQHRQKPACRVHPGANSNPGF